jgi:hypothetical protein
MARLYGDPGARLQLRTPNLFSQPERLFLVG